MFPEGIWNQRLCLLLFDCVVERIYEVQNSTCVILIAIIIWTFGALVLGELALLSGTVMSLVALYLQTEQRKVKKTFVVRRQLAHRDPPFPHTPVPPPKVSVAEVLDELDQARVYIDGPYLLKSLEEYHLDMHYERFLSALEKQVFNIEKAYFYIKEDLELPDYGSFKEKLKNSKFDVIERYARKIGDRTICKDIDTWLATDVALDASDVNTLVLVTGDNDFAYTVKRLQQIKKKVVVVSIDANTSHELQSLPDQWLNITNLTGVCEKKEIPSKLPESQNIVSSPSCKRTVRPKPKPILNRPVRVNKPNRNTA
ncbi:hypothetical protein Lepto7375DRAFT_0080 [Leptolyngbya sp. PCC 7375]|nr:hypothetical protein Lepto7375DRAFT_0080 [Leptolyngbya sp. PCC 7375]